MKTQQEVEEMKNEIQEKIQRAQNMARNKYDPNEFKYWHDLKIQLIAQYNILLDVLDL